MPHQPISTSEAFLTTSPRGLYGDVVRTIDAGVGRILATLQEEGIDEAGYRLILNCRAHAGQEVFHVHLHLLGGRPLGRMLSDP